MKHRSAPSLPLPPLGQRPVTPLNPDRAYLLEFARLQKNFVRGEGSWLTDEAGVNYLDFNAQYGAVPFGHNPPELWSIVERCRAENLPALVQPAIAPAARELASRLLAVAPGSMRHVTFCCTGAETVEAAIKLARARTGRPGILSLERGYHGKTLGALSATGRAEYQRPFFAPVSGFRTIPFGDLEALEAVLEIQASELAAFFFEPVQGEGGMRPLPEGYLREAARLCKRHGVLLVADEVQTGLGRTGTLFACETEGIEPDVLLLSKALGGGLFPLGAVLCTADAWSQDFGMLHSSTFANHALACRVGLGVLERVSEPRFLEQVRARSAQLRGGLEQLAAEFPDVVSGVSGRGLMQALVLDGSSYTGEDSLVLSALVQEGTLAPFLCGHLVNVWKLWVAPLLSMENALRLEPVLTVAAEEIDFALAALRGCVEALHRRDAGALLRYQLGDERKPELGGAGYQRPELRVEPARVEVGEGVRRFAFFAHYTDLDDLRRSEPSFAGWTETALRDWTRRTGSHTRPLPTCKIPAFRSKAGTVAEGWLITVGLLPEQLLYLGQRRGTSLLREGVAVARDLGATRLGLGAFTSVVTAGGQSLTGLGVPITSGNTYTVLVAVDAVEEACRRLGQPLANARVAVVGAGGSIGRLASILLAERARELILIGNRDSVDRVARMRRISGEIYRSFLKDPALRAQNTVVQEGKPSWWGPGGKAPASRLTQSLPSLQSTAAWPALLEALSASGEEADERLAAAVEEAYALAGLGEPPVRAAFELEGVLPACDVVLCATSSAQGAVDPMLLRPGAIVCDVALPPDLAIEARKRRPDVLIFDGGLARYPSSTLAAGFNFGFPPGVGPGCFSETMLLALEGDTLDRSVGRRLELADLGLLRAAAARHGFESGGLRSRSRMLGESDFASVREALRARDATRAGAEASSPTQERGAPASTGAMETEKTAFRGRRRAPLAHPGGGAG